MSTPGSLNPFPGLRAFTQEEDYLFFGREEQTMELLQRLGGNRFVAVVGTSGSGKSSLVRCGLLSELLGGKMIQAGAAWEIAVTHPGGNPMALLTEALIDADLYDRDTENVRENLLATLSRSHFGLVEAVKQSDIRDDTNFLLVVDQFEEIFRFHEAGQLQQEIANEFVSLLLEAVAQTEVPIYVVLTMRSDFIGECGQFEGLAEKVNKGEFLIPRLTRDQYKRVIEGPIKVAGGKIAPRLLQRLLNDLGQQADQLPCLQHALMRTWDVWAERGDSEALDLDDYQRVGKMAQALSLHADEVFASLADDRQRALCENMFRALTVQESEGRGIRRPQRLSGLCQILEAPLAELVPIIDAYRRHGVTFLMPPAEVELTETTIIDISHESLMRVWMRLRQWVDEEAQAAGIYRRLSESATLHAAGKAGLYRDPELGIALAWREENRPNQVWAERYQPGFEVAMAFLQSSREAEEAEEAKREAARQKELEQAQKLAKAEQRRATEQARAAVRLRWLVRGLGVVAMVAVAAMLMAWSASREARSNATLAAQKATDAETAQRATQKALGEVEVAKGIAEQNLSRAEKAQAEALKAERRSREFRYATDILLAGRILEDDTANAGQVLERLVDYDPASNSSLSAGDDLRGFEWHYLRGRVDARATVFRGFESVVIGSALNDRNELVVLEKDGRLTRWNAETRAMIGAPLDLKQGRSLGALALSPDGARVALAIGNRVHLVDAMTGKESALPLPAQARIGMLFSQDSRMLVTVDSLVGWWDAATGKAIALDDSKVPIRSGPVSLSADGLTLAVGGIAGRFTSQSFSIFRLDAATREIGILQDKRDANAGSIRTLALSPDGKSLLASQFFAGILYRYSTEDEKGKVSHSRADHSASVSAIAYDPTTGGMVTADLDGTMLTWNADGPATGGLMGHAQLVDRISFVRDSSRVISSGKDGTVRLWNLEAGETSSQGRKELASSGQRAAYSPDGLLVAAAERVGKKLKIMDAATGALVVSLTRTGDDGLTPDSLAFSPDGRLLAAGFGGLKDKSFIELWDIDRRERLAVMPGTTDIPGYPTSEDNGMVSGLAFSPDGRYLAAGFGTINTLSSGDRGDFPIKIYDVAKRRTIRRLAGPRNNGVAVKFSKDGSRLACACFDGNAYVWDTASWQLSYGPLSNPDTASDLGGRRVQDVAFSPDGSRLAMASAEGNVHIWNAATGEHLETLGGHGNSVWSVAFSPDGRTLASGSEDNTIRLWNRATWREVLILGDAGKPRSLTFSPDGFELLSAGHPAFQWSARPLDEDVPERLAKQLGKLLKSAADFASRLRMLSETPHQREALEQLAARETNRIPVLSALAAARANWRASREEWKEAVAQFDRLKELGGDTSAGARPSGRSNMAGTGDIRVIPPTGETNRTNVVTTGTVTNAIVGGGSTVLRPEGRAPADWLRTSGLLRLATALLHEDRATEAASLLTGGEKRRAEDGNGRRVNGFGFFYATGKYPLKLRRVYRGSPSWRAGLREGDVLLKYNNIELNEDNHAEWGTLANGPVGTQLSVTFQKPGQDQPETVQLTKASYIQDDLTVELIEKLEAAIAQRPANATNEPGGFELRAEIAGLSSDYALQITNYTAAIELLEKHEPKPDSNLQRLHARRGAVHGILGNWHAVAADLERALVDGSSDVALRSLRAKARADLLATESVWRRFPSQDIGLKGVTVATVDADGSMKRRMDAPSTTSADAVDLTLPPDLTKPRALLVEWPEPGRTYEQGRPDFRAERLDTPVSANGSLIGRFVRLDLPGDNERFPRMDHDKGMRMINLAELQVFQGDTNIAAGKQARQSSTLGKSVADRAVDGNTDGSQAAQSFAHTDGGSDPNPWWEIDLGAERAMDRIVIWNRNGWHGRMKHFRIQILDNKRRVVFATYSAEPPRPSLTIQTIAISAPSAQTKTNQISLKLASLPSVASRNPRLSVSESHSAMEQLDLDARVVEINSWRRLAIALIDRDNHQALDQLVADNPEAAGPVGELFAGGQLVDWRRAIQLYSRGIESEVKDRELLAKRARAYEELKDWNAAAADWVRVAQLNPNGPGLVREFAERLDKAGQTGLAVAQRNQAREMLAARLKADPDDITAMEQMAQLIIDLIQPREPEWTALKPVSLKTENGSSLAVMEDDSLRIERGKHVLSFSGGDEVKAVRIQTASKAAAIEEDASPFKEYRILSTALPTNGFRGRFVRIDLPSGNPRHARLPSDEAKNYSVLSLAEVQVFDEQENLALRGAASQSTDYQSGTDGKATAERALDGNTDGAHQNGSVTHTSHADREPWWEVDLGKDTSFGRIVVWNRTDGDSTDPLRDRLKYFRVRILDAARNVVFERFIEKAPNPSREIRREVQWAKTAPASPDGENQWQLNLGAGAGFDGGRRFKISSSAAMPSLPRNETEAKEMTWMTPAPRNVTPAPGTTLAVRADGSLLVNRDQTNATDALALSSLPATVKALRIETASLDSASTNGAPAFTEYRVQAIAASGSDSVPGRFVRIDLPGNNREFPRMDGALKMINLAELQVFSGGENVSLGKKARQSSTYKSSGANLAVDGNTDGTGEHLVAHTIDAGRDTEPWWEVNLSEERNIERVVVWNRTDGKQARMNHFRVRILDADRNVIFEQVIDKAPNPSTEIRPPAFGLEANEDAAGMNSPVSLRVPLDSAWSRFRLSAATNLVSLNQRDGWNGVMKIASVSLRLAAAYDLEGAIAAAAERFRRSLDFAKDAARQTAILKQLENHPESLTELLKQQPEDAGLQLTLARIRVATGLKNLLVNDPAAALARFEQARDLFEGLPTIQAEPLVSTSETDGITWRFTTNGPAADWAQPGFDGSAWPEAVGPFGTDPHYSRRTPWRSPDIWMRRSFEWTPAPPSERLALRIHHDDDAEVYLNGIPVANLPDYSGDGHVWSPLSATAVAALRPGANVLAVHCRNKSGWQCVDVGLFRHSHSVADLLARSELKNPELAALDMVFGKAYAQQANATKAAAAFSRALERTPEPAERKKLIEQLPGDAAVTTLLAEKFPTEISLQLALAKLHAETGKKALAAKRLDEALPSLNQSREIFARLLADHAETQWAVIRPTELETEAGTELTLQADGSILASGENAARESYTLTLGGLTAPVAAVRLEAVTDDSLPRKGPGRSASGTFALSRFAILDAEDNALAWSSVTVDHPSKLSAQLSAQLDQVRLLTEAQLDQVPEQIRTAAKVIAKGFDITKAIDDDPDSVWITTTNADHVAQFTLREALEPNGESVLRFRLDMAELIPSKTGGSLGRFRVSVTSQTNFFEADQLRQEIKASGLTELELSLGEAHAQQGRTNEAAAAFGRALDLAVDRPARWKMIAAASGHSGVLEKLADLKLNDARVQDALARHYRAAGDSKRALEAAKKARALYEKQLAAEPANAQLAKDLTGLLVVIDPVEWTVLKPVEMKSAGGSELKLLEDGSILASGKNPDEESYTILADLPLTPLAAVRLELVPDVSFPGGGSGRSGNGSFTLTEISAFLAPPGGDPVPVKISSGAATFSENGGDTALVARAIDGKADTYWNTYPKMTEHHSAVFKLASPVVAKAGHRFEIRLNFKSVHKHANLGRFRLSTSGDINEIVMPKTGSPWAALGAAYLSLGEHDRAMATFAGSFERAADGAAKATAAREAAAFEDIFAKLQERWPGDPSLLLGQAKHLAPKQIAENQFPEAVEVISGALKSFPNDIELLNLRAQTKAKLRQWQGASEDYARVIELETDDGKRRAAERSRAEVQLRLGQFQEAADVYLQEMLLSPGDFYRLYAACSTLMLSGNPGMEKVAARRLYKKFQDTKKGYAASALVLVFTAQPGLIDQGNRQKLLAAAKQAGGFWSAAIHYRLGDLKQAEPLLTKAKGKPHFEALGAMLLYDLGRTNAARSFLDAGPGAWFQRERAKDPTSVIPAQQRWQEWGLRIAVWREAARKLAGPRLQELDELLAKAPDKLPELLERARLLADAGLHEDALQDLDHALKFQTDPSQAHGLRGLILVGLNRDKEALAALNLAIEMGARDADVYAARGAILLKQGKTSEARTDLEQSLELEPNESAASLLANLLLAEADQAAGWTVLQPVTTKSEGGATLTRLADGSILASGPNPLEDVYHLTFEPGMEGITAFRLEALPNPSLPAGGPGRYDNGNFHLSEFRVRAGETPVKLDAMQVTYTEASGKLGDGLGILNSNTDTNRYWSNHPRNGRKNVAVIRTAEAAGAGPLTVQLSFSLGRYKRHGLGRFRLSFHRDPGAFDRESRRLAVVAERENPWASLALAYAALADTKSSTSSLDDIEQGRDLFTRLLAAYPEPEWTILKPSRVTSQGGATLTALGDGSILAGGENPKKEVYEFAATWSGGPLTAIRLEALTHPSVAFGSHGRSPGNGNVVLTEFEAEAASAENPNDWRPIKFLNSWTDHPEASQRLEAAIDGDPKTGWVTYHKGIPLARTAVFAAQAPFGRQSGTHLRIRLRHESQFGQHAFGRMRLSVTRNANAIQAAGLRQRFRTAGLQEFDLALGRAHAGRGQADEAAAAFRRAFDLATDQESREKVLSEAATHEGLLEKVTVGRPILAAEIGGWYSKREDWNQALVFLDQALAAETRDVALLALRGEAFGRLKQWDAADADWKRVFGLKPEDEALRQRWNNSLTEGRRWQDLATYYSEVLDGLPPGRFTYQPRYNRIEKLIRRKDGVFDALIALRPGDTLLPVSLARDAVLRNDWAKAVDLYPKALGDKANLGEWYEYAATLLLSGKTDAYREYVKQALAETADKATQTFNGYALARMAILSPEETVPWEQVVALAEIPASREVEKGHYPHVAAMAQLRAGNLDKAQEWLEKSVATKWHPELNQLALCLLHSQRGDKDKAREDLKQARAWLADREAAKEDGYYKVQATDWLEFHILLREAEAAVKP